MNRFFLLFLFLLPFTSQAKIDDMSLHVGTLTEHVGKIQTSESGSTRKFDFSPFFVGELEWRFFEDYSLLPRLACGLPESGEDSNISRFHYQFSLDFGYHYQDLLFTLGAGLSFTRLTSDGGEVTLDNGLGQTAFPLPDFTSTSRNFIISSGLNYSFSQKWSAGADVYAFNISDTEKRSFSYLLKVGHHFGAWE